MTSSASPRLLLIEDDPDTACLIEEALVDHFGPESVRRHCSTVAETLEVDLQEFDLVLSDINLPDGSGLELLGELLNRRSDIPVVFVTGEGILENAISAIRRGAYDYIVKAGDYLFAVPLMVEKNLEIWNTKQENARLGQQLAQTLEEVRIKNKQLEEVVKQLEAMAATDPLTGLANRRTFGQAMARSFAHAKRFQQDLACIMIDLDGFKEFNDTFGHQRGDEILRRAAEVLQRCCRQSDVPGRFGGDEFIVLLPQADERIASQVAHRIQETFEEMRRESEEPGQVTLSIGLACLSQCDATNPEQLANFADHALYRAKQAGKNRLVLYRKQDNAKPVGTDQPMTSAAASRVPRRITD